MVLQNNSKEPVSASLANGDGTYLEVNLAPGERCELPEKNSYIKTLIDIGILVPVVSVKENNKQK